MGDGDTPGTRSGGTTITASRSASRSSARPAIATSPRVRTRVPLMWECPRKVDGAVATSCNSRSPPDSRSAIGGSCSSTAPRATRSTNTSIGKTRRPGPERLPGLRRGRHRLRGTLAHAIQPPGRLRAWWVLNPRQRRQPPRRRPRGRLLRHHRRQQGRAEARGLPDRGDDRPPRRVLDPGQGQGDVPGVLPATAG